MKVKRESEVVQSCLILSYPMDYSLLGSSIHGIFQARVLEWGPIAFSVGGLGFPYSLFYLFIYFLMWTTFKLWASQVAQLVKNPPAMQETQVRFLGLEVPLEKG